MPSSKRNATRRSCRAYRSRLVETFGKATATWGYLHDVEAPRFEPTQDISCTELAREAKAFLLACPVEDQEATFAWNSIKKLQPASCRCMEASLVRSVADHFSSPPPSLPSGYISFVRRVVRQMFPHGWDASSYERFVRTVDPPISACDEVPRSYGGVHGLASERDSSFRQSDFLSTCLEGARRPLSTRSYLTVVQSAGKPRPLSKFSADALHLKPLHKSIYEHISRFSWLCRGDFTSEKLRDAGFSFCEGETLTSGDYKSATDNLSIEVAEAIMDELLQATVSVPGSMKAYAMSILRPSLYNLEFGIDEFSPSRGQMMGSMLSFPLLCIQNRIAFLYSGHSVGIDCSEFPCLINGDDILFRSGPHFSALWMDVVRRLSLEVERSKTSVSPQYGSLNSTLCVRYGKRYRVVPTIRMGMLRESESLDSLARGFDDFIKGLKGTYRFKAAMAWFSWNIGKIRPLGLTTYDLGFRGPLAYRATKRFGLSTTVTHTPIPALSIDNGLSLSSSGCEFVDPEVLCDEDKVVNLCELAAWKWRTSFKASDKKEAAMRFHLAISATRVDSPSFGPLFWGSDECELTRKWHSAKMYSVPLEKRNRGFPVLAGYVGRLPSYEEVLAGETDVGSVEPFTEKKEK
jgi:hypothetical protein